MSRIPESHIELILSMYEETGGNASKARRIVGKGNYFQRNQDYSRRTIIKYWRERGNKIGSRGGPNTLGKTWTKKRH